ncbi:WD repeat-containing protein 44 [Geranomyces michiganensis]|nr:WD repeat-containing protein 44 [Geranomyces michiganensis]
MANDRSSIPRSASRSSMPPLVPGYSSPTAALSDAYPIESPPSSPPPPANSSSGGFSFTRKLPLPSRSRSKSKQRSGSGSSGGGGGSGEVNGKGGGNDPGEPSAIPHISITRPKPSTSSLSDAFSRPAARMMVPNQMDPLAAHLEDMAGAIQSVSREHTPDGSSDDDIDDPEAAFKRMGGSASQSPEKIAGFGGKLKTKKSFFGRFRREKKTEAEHLAHLDSQFSIADFDETGLEDGTGESERGKHVRMPVKVKTHRKPRKDFEQLARVQVLGGDTMGLNIDVDRSTEKGLIFAANDVDAEIKGPVWALRFSKCGKYLAAGGQDGIIRIWKLACATPEPLNDGTSGDGSHVGSAGGSVDSSNRATPLGSSTSLFGSDRGNPGFLKGKTPSFPHVESPRTTPALGDPIFDETPFRVFKGHSAPILDITWSRHGFIASASMDKTVRIWHVDLEECLCALTHKGCVTSARFHPTDDRYVLTGSLDARIRLWSIEEKRVVAWNETPNGSYVTAVSFTRDGTMCAAGTFTGECIFYEVDGLKYNTQIEVKSSKDRHSKKKITGIEPLPFPWGGEERLLITSNDSRVRMYNVRDKSLIRKYKGLECRASQIKATFSDDGRFLIAGSEDRQVYIWNLYPLGSYGGYHMLHAGDQDSIVRDTAGGGGGHLLGGLMNWQPDASRSSSWERFPGSAEAITCTVFAPKGTKDILYGPSPAAEHGESESMQDLLNYSTEGALIVIADMMGRVRVFENRAVPTDAAQHQAGSATSSNVTSPRSPTFGSAATLRQNGAAGFSRDVINGHSSSDEDSRRPVRSKRYSSPPQTSGMRRSTSDLTGSSSNLVAHHLASEPSPRAATSPMVHSRHSYHSPAQQPQSNAYYHSDGLNISTEMLETHFPPRTSTPRSNMHSPSHLDSSHSPSDGGADIDDGERIRESASTGHLDAILKDMSLAAKTQQQQHHQHLHPHHQPQLHQQQMRRARSATIDSQLPAEPRPSPRASLLYASSTPSAPPLPPQPQSRSRDFLNLVPGPAGRRHLKENSIEEER